MMAWRLLAMLSFMWVAQGALAQEPPTVFRSDAYVVAIDIRLRDFSAKWRGEPLLGFTSDDFSVTLEKGIAVSATVVPWPTKPGFYRVTFSPPDSLRDGKKHRIEITVAAVPSKNRPPGKVRLQVKFDKGPN